MFLFVVYMQILKYFAKHAFMFFEFFAEYEIAGQLGHTVWAYG